MNNDQIARIAQVFKSPVGEDILQLFGEKINNEVACLMDAQDSTKMFRTQGRAAAFTELFQLFSGLKSFEPATEEPPLFVYGSNAPDPQGHPEA